MTAKGVHNTEDMFKWFKKKHPKSDVNKKQFKYVVDEYFKRVVQSILEGKTYNMGHRLGKFRIKKIKRTYNKPIVDYYETKKMFKEGKNVVVYYTDEYWYRYYWEKRVCQVKNKTVYSFKPTKGASGNTKKLVAKLKGDEFAYLLYSE